MFGNSLRAGTTASSTDSGQGSVPLSKISWQSQFEIIKGASSMSSVLSWDSLTISLTMSLPNHLSSAFLPANKSRFFVQKDNDLEKSKIVRNMAMTLKLSS
jgi:hypothetical protein